MNFLLFSDLHRDRTATRQLVELSRTVDIDIVIGAGDFATARRGLRDTIDILSAITQPAVLVPGNSESPEELQAAVETWPSATVLHGSGTVIQGVPFWGLGGAVPPTPFDDWSYDLTEEAAAHLLQDCPQGGVLVTHAPPKGLLDVSSSGKSLGSRAVKETLERCRPVLLVCGHIHDSSSQRTPFGDTTVINAGPRGMVFRVDHF